MREILFRGKSKNTGEWVYGYLVKGFYWLGENNPMTVIFPDEVIFYPRCEVEKWEEVIPETVGQFIGLLDLHGTKIFEGDIVDTPGWVVTYCDDTNAGLGINAGLYLQRDDFESWSELENEDWHMVLGNIHDNPELLTKGDKYYVKNRKC